MKVYVLSFIITTRSLYTHLSPNDRKLEYRVQSGVKQLPHRGVGDILLHRQENFSLSWCHFCLISSENYKLRLEINMMYIYIPFEIKGGSPWWPKEMTREVVGFSQVTKAVHVA
jgi:hypothetical protein